MCLSPWDRWSILHHNVNDYPGGNRSSLVQRVIPALRIMDYERSKTYYTDGLGFRVVWEHRFEPRFPVFMKVERDGMALYLTEHSGDCQVGALVHLDVADVDAWHAEFVGRGVPIQERPNNGLPGLRMMTVADPDGNQLRFLTRTDGSAQ